MCWQSLSGIKALAKFGAMLGEISTCSVVVNMKLESLAEVCSKLKLQPGWALKLKQKLKTKM